ncbi:hypothetical protein CFIMG_007114RA [Ceratocystis fimbriata CBS 114723]|uniref:Glycoside hydrolase 131 catalytic N-terminal domain-containing protein n=1 Tax=Ceratocystis fimbriata CBS 114723 TaxID=1035309 RepID=A0A2C5WDE7_9PEZI|nr:hypothetical protein CFIMG_007114RA [Ceratocystis fimbriata CBS 114723]
MQSLSLLALIAPVAAQVCQLAFDGRVAKDFALEGFDADTSPFNPSNVFGKGLKWSEILKFPEGNGGLFDVDTKPIEVTINDTSIFAPSETNVQNGFRRAELLIASNSGTDPSTTGIKTLHFSLKKDAQRPLDTSHEYQLVFLEDSTYSTNQFVLKTGTVLTGDGASDPDTLQLFGNVNQKEPGMIFSAPFTPGTFHNFGLKLDFTANTTQVFYSTGNCELTQQTEPISNDVSGQGQFHFGILKKPTGETTDVTKSGFQPAGIDEGIIYSGIFSEDSADGCVSLSPTKKL